MNSRALKDKVRNIAKVSGIDSQALMQNFFLERILFRISKSEYKDNIILKGGFLVALIIGNEKRSTMDLDVTIKSYPAVEEQVVKMIKSVLDIEGDDEIDFQYVGIKSIREEDKYAGFRISVDAKFERIVQHLKLDLTTGDKITPEEINYSFKSMFFDEEISVLAYNLETIISEKFETVLSRGTANTRMRDYYDLYILCKLKRDEIDFKLLHEAMLCTSRKRDTKYVLEYSFDIIESLKDSKEIKKLWVAYQNIYPYALAIKFEEVIEILKLINQKVFLDHDNT